MIKDQDRRTVRLRPASYQPTKAEVEEDMSIDATPDELARSAFRPVNIKTISKEDD